MTEIQIFSNKAFGQVRVVERDGEAWFVARDVALALGYEDPADAVQRHCKKANDSNMGVSPTIPSPKIIPESDVYRLIMRSNLPDAERFQDWVCEEILPAIRKHGGYLTPAKIEEALSDPDTLIRLATDLKAERQRRAALEQKVEADRPKVVFADSIEVSKTSILVGELAKLITQSTGYNIGQNRLYTWLREHGYIHKQGSQKRMPTQRSVNAGWIEIKEGTRIGADGESRITKTSKVTGKGQIYFINLFKEAAEHQVA